MGAIFEFNGHQYQLLAHKDEDGCYGGLYRNQPTPSGSTRWLIQLSDKRRFERVEDAMDAFRKLLKPEVIQAEALAEKQAVDR